MHVNKVKSLVCLNSIIPCNKRHIKNKVLPTLSNSFFRGLFPFNPVGTPLHHYMNMLNPDSCGCHELLTTLKADLQLILVVALKSCTELALKDGEKDSVDSRGVFAFSSVFALDEHELSLQWNVLSTCSHSLGHPPELETE